MIVLIMLSLILPQTHPSSITTLMNLIDLGPDVYDGGAPLKLRQALANATLSDDYTVNQMTTKNGRPRLLKAVAKMYSNLINRDLHPDDNVLITAGATEACYAAFKGFTLPGDEWIVIEPFYSLYVPMIRMARGIPRFTTMKLKRSNASGIIIYGDDWELDRVKLEGLFSEKTRGLIFNNPINPIGKVFTRDDLEFVASLAVKYDVLVIADEAHEFVTHKPHVRLASLPDMFDRTVTIGTASKSFSVGGWRIGWAYGPSHLLDRMKTVHRHVVNSAPSPQQEAIAFGFEEEMRTAGTKDSYFASNLKDVLEKRDMMVRTLGEVGMTPTVSDGGYCLIADWSSLKSYEGGGGDVKFVEWLRERIGVVAVPMSAFYSEEHRYLAERYVRFCFHKTDETIADAVCRFDRLKRSANDE